MLDGAAGGDVWRSARGETKLGVVLAPYGADAMLLASKCKSVRPVLGTRAESVAAAVRHFGANLLVLEEALSTHHEMRQMVRTIAAPRGEPSHAALLERVAKQEGRT